MGKTDLTIQNIEKIRRHFLVSKPSKNGERAVSLCNELVSIRKREIESENRQENLFPEKPFEAPSSRYEVWTDGSCDNVGGKQGGYGFVVLMDGEMVYKESKGFLKTTNNKMEMLAIIRALSVIPEGENVVVNTDSQYCILMFTKPSSKIKPDAKNMDLIREYHEVASKLGYVRFSWVKGHNGSKWNEFVDGLAYKAYLDITEKNHMKPSYMMKYTH
jgi:ribonuclease HI